MDVFQWWENLWNPLAKPTADLGAEALRKYQAGEIDFATYQAAADQAAGLDRGIAAAGAAYRETVAEKYSLDPGAVLKPLTDAGKNLIVLALIVGTVYLAVQWRRA